MISTALTLLRARAGLKHLAGVKALVLSRESDWPRKPVWVARSASWKSLGPAVQPSSNRGCADDSFIGKPKRQASTPVKDQKLKTR
jgi:hypothetical protein